jgi:hypothetical protein
MSGYRHLSKPTHSGKTEEDWVDFPASFDPDPWATLLREPNRLNPDGDAEHAAGAAVTPIAIALRGLLVTTAAVAIVAYLLLTNSHI